jgi:hypothetical protein
MVGDIDNDGVVNGHDLNILIVNWGKNYPPAEFNGSGNTTVVGNNLNELIVNWLKTDLLGGS